MSFPNPDIEIEIMLTVAGRGVGRLCGLASGAGR